MSDPLSCDYQHASLNHLRDALAMTPAQRWQWLRETMDFGEQVARQRAERGLVTLSASGKVLWSPELAREWEAGQNLSRTYAQRMKWLEEMAALAKRARASNGDGV